MNFRLDIEKFNLGVCVKLNREPRVIRGRARRCNPAFF
jgi:hypothetical protein